MCIYIFMFFFFKQKTAYEMRISDWSSDVCSSDLATTRPQATVTTVATTATQTVLSAALISWSETMPASVRRSSDSDSRYTAGTKIGRASCRERVCQYV